MSERIAVENVDPKFCERIEQTKREEKAIIEMLLPALVQKLAELEKRRDGLWVEMYKFYQLNRDKPHRIDTKEKRIYERTDISKITQPIGKG